MLILPIPHPLSATVRVPGSKSLTNRALLIASLAEGTTCLTNALFSDDSRTFAKALQTLGFDIQLNEANHEMTVTGLGGKIPANKAELFIGNAGTAARFPIRISHSRKRRIYFGRRRAHERTSHRRLG